MTSALISLAASSLLALNAGNSGGQASAPAAPAAQQVRASGPIARGKGPVAGANASRVSGARPAGARPSNARSASGGDSHARTPPPDRSGASGGSSASAPPPSSGGGSPPPPSSSGGYHAPPRGASSHAVPANAPYGPRPGPHAPPPPPHYTTWTAAQQRAYVMHHYHVAPYAPRYWATGVFIYQPPPPPPRVAGAPRRAAKVAEPARDVDHSNSLSIGLQTGSYLSGYANGASYGDLGFGVNARYRGNEALGVEVSYGYFSDSFTSSTERVTQPLSASVDLFAFPWTKVSPYLSGGVTWTARSYDDTIAMASPNQPAQTFQTRDLQFGPHIGLGLELSLGKKSSIDLEGRYTHFVTHEDGLDVSSPDNLQGIVGLNMYF